MRKVINSILIVLGFVSIGLGILGIVLPILPTTPFLLLGAGLFAKGSDRFHKWFVSTKLYHKYIDKAVHSKEMTRKEKIHALGAISLLFVIGFIVSPIWHAKALIIFIAIGHFYYFIFRIKTVKSHPKITRMAED